MRKKHFPEVHDEEKLFMKSTAKIQKSLFEFQQQTAAGILSTPVIEEHKDQFRIMSDISKCNFPHDSISDKIDRGLVGTKTSPNLSKTENQRMRAQKKSMKKIAKSN